MCRWKRQWEWAEHEARLRKKTPPDRQASVTYQWEPVFYFFGLSL